MTSDSKTFTQQIFEALKYNKPIEEKDLVVSEGKEIILERVENLFQEVDNVKNQINKCKDEQHKNELQNLIDKADKKIKTILGKITEPDYILPFTVIPKIENELEDIKAILADIKDNTSMKKYINDTINIDQLFNRQPFENKEPNKEPNILNLLKETLKNTRLLIRHPNFIRFINSNYENIPIISTVHTENKEEYLNKENVKKLIYIENNDYINETFKKIFLTFTNNTNQIKTYVLLKKLIEKYNNETSNNNNETNFIIKTVKIILGKNEQLKNITTYNNIKELKPDGIITFVKIRNDNQGTSDNRFDIGLDTGAKSIKIKAKEPKYDNNNTYSLSDNFIDQFVFGPFTKIFKPQDTAETIVGSAEFTQIKQKLLDYKPVVIIGYGTSGSGKTSTLIQFVDKNNNNKEPGVLINLLNSIEITTNFTTIKVSFIEIGKGECKGECKETDIIVGKNIENKEYGEKVFNKNNNIWSDQDQVNLADHIINTMNKRDIKGTPNNPVSSRSHVMIFVELINNNNNNSTHLVVCDFAGVENKFNCNEDKVIERFRAIKKNDGTPFYKLKPEDKSEDESEDELKKQLEAWTYLYQKKEIKRFLNFFISDYDSFKEDKETKQDNNKKFDHIYVLKVLNLDQQNIEDVAKKAAAEAAAKTKAAEAAAEAAAKTKGKKGAEAAKAKTKAEAAEATAKTKAKDTDPQQVINTKYKNFTIENIQKKIKEITDKLARFENIKTLQSHCNERVNEGIFINDSLRALRLFISHYLKTKNARYPNFEDLCLPIQCNPYTDECFGISEEEKNKENEPVSVLMEKMREKMGDKMRDSTFVIFNVLNITPQDNNKPLPTEYTDISGLIQERNRLKNLYLYNYTQEETGKETKEVNQVNQYFIDDIKKRGSIKTYDTQTQKTIITLIEKLQKSINDIQDKTNYVETQIINLNNLIEYITTINATSIIGTMEFTDMMAKFGKNTNICNFRNINNQELNDKLSKFSQPYK